MKLEDLTFVSIYESSSGDGYTNSPSGKYYIDKNDGVKASSAMWGHVIIHHAIELDDGTFLLLSSAEPVEVFRSHIESVVKQALSKLTSEEADALKHYFT